VNVPALAYLSDHGRFPALTRLALAGNKIDPTGLKALLRAPFAADLTHLDLATNQLGNDGAVLLAETTLLRLRWLSLEYNGVGATGFLALARSGALPRLETVRYAGNAGGDWWRPMRERFTGDEPWVDMYFPDGIPF
jgi:hypothetical protein